MSERELKAGHLRKLAVNWQSFKSGQLEDWLDRLDFADSSDVAEVVRLFIERDPRESESVRKSMPTLADIMKRLPRKTGSNSEQFPCVTWDPARGEIEFHGGLTEDTLSQKSRVDIGVSITKELTQKWVVVGGKRVAKTCFEWDTKEAQANLAILRRIDPSGYNALLRLKEANSQTSLEMETTA